jgi:hypothetical protein
MNGAIPFSDYNNFMVLMSMLQGLSVLAGGCFMMAMTASPVVYYFGLTSMALSMTAIQLLAGSYESGNSRGFYNKIPKYVENTFIMSILSLLFALFGHVVLEYINGIYSLLGSTALFTYIAYWCVVYYCTRRESTRDIPFRDIPFRDIPFRDIPFREEPS